MRVLIDTSLLVEGERRNFDLGKWVATARHEVFICDATRVLLSALLATQWPAGR